MSDKSPIDFLKHILDECVFILNSVPKDLTKTELLEKEILKRAMPKLIHDYAGINYNIVWDVVKNKIPILKTQIEKVIAKEKTNE